MAAFEPTRHIVSHEGNAEWVSGAEVSRDLMSVLRIQPILGRGFTPEEDQVGGPKVVLLAQGFWKRRFGGREEVVGQTLRLNQENHTIVGVLPSDESVLLEADYWVPLAYDTRKQQGWHLRGVGRLKAGITLDMAREDLRRVHQGLVAEKRANENTSPRLTSLSDRYFGDKRLIIRLLLGAVAVVLLIACGNVAALMLARGLARARELGLRLSLGATRWQLARLIGVARDVKHYGLDQPGIPGVYLPFAQDPQAHMSLVVRSSAAPTSLVPSIQALVREHDPELPISGVVTMEERLRQSMWARRLTASVFEIFSGVALLMAAGGLYGVFSYAVSRRTQEIGVRLALGAQGGEILWLVIRQGLVLSAGGIGIGLFGARLATPVTRHLLYGVSPFEPFTITAATLGLLLVAVLACWIPARRAMKVDPVESLRCE
jgi:hypothetical protein